MKTSKPPRTDSIQELAKFWDTHDLTDFEDDLEEVTEPVFVRRKSITVPLQTSEAAADRKMAKNKGVSQGELIRGWILQKIAPRKGNRKIGSLTKETVSKKS